MFQAIDDSKLNSEVLQMTASVAADAVQAKEHSNDSLEQLVNALRGHGLHLCRSHLTTDGTDIAKLSFDVDLSRLSAEKIEELQRAATPLQSKSNITELNETEDTEDDDLTAAFETLKVTSSEEVLPPIRQQRSGNGEAPPGIVKEDDFSPPPPPPSLEDEENSHETRVTPFSKALPSSSFDTPPVRATFEENGSKEVSKHLKVVNNVVPTAFHKCPITGLQYRDKLEYYSSMEHATKATSHYLRDCKTNSTRALALNRFFTKCYHSTKGLNGRNMGRLQSGSTLDCLFLAKPPGKKVNRKPQYVGHFITIFIDSENGREDDDVNELGENRPAYISEDATITAYDCETHSVMVDYSSSSKITQDNLQGAQYLIRLPVEKEVEEAILHEPSLVFARSTEGTNRNLRFGWTPLHIAAYSGNPKLCQVLLKLGALPYERDLTGRMPLHTVASYPKKIGYNNFSTEINHVETIRILMKALEKHTGESPIGSAAPTDLSGCTPAACLLEGSRSIEAENLLHKAGDSFVSPFISRVRRKAQSTAKTNSLRKSALKHASSAHTSVSKLNKILHKHIRFQIPIVSDRQNQNQTPAEDEKENCLQTDHRETNNDDWIEHNEETAPFSLHKSGHIAGRISPFGTPGHGGKLYAESLIYGMAELNGFRPTMEDAVCVHQLHDVPPGLSGSLHATLFGLFDGHGGDEAARFCAAQVANQVRLSSGFHQANWSKALRLGVLRLDHSLRKHQCYGRRGVYSPQENASKLNKTDSSQGAAFWDKSGAVGVLFLATSKELIFANIGDCRALLVRNDGSFEQMTIDHKADMPEEKKRVEAAGLEVKNGRVYKSSTLSLGMSRAFGDFEFKAGLELGPWKDCSNAAEFEEELLKRMVKSAVSCEPNICTVPRTSDIKYVLLACDGVFDTMSNAECLDILKEVENFPNSAEAINHACEILVQEALEKGSRDNCTAICISLCTDRNIENPARKRLFNFREVSKNLRRF
eukprot:g864.t1